MSGKKSSVVPITQNEISAMATKKQIASIIEQLKQLPKTSVEYDEKEDKLNHIYISNVNQFVPDFELIWCSIKNHYRVYICLASKSDTIKTRGNNYCICVLRSTLDASEFVNTYLFFHRHRGNNKSLD